MNHAKCPICDSNLDYGEKCGCQKPPTKMEQLRLGQAEAERKKLIDANGQLLAELKPTDGYVPGYREYSKWDGPKGLSVEELKKMNRTLRIEVNARRLLGEELYFATRTRAQKIELYRLAVKVMQGQSPGKRGEEVETYEAFFAQRDKCMLIAGADGILGNAAKAAPEKGPSVQDIRFQQFWLVYPKKVGRLAALRVWGRLRPDEELHNRILAAVAKQAESVQWQRDNGAYIPNPETWLRQGRWDDELPQNFGAETPKRPAANAPVESYRASQASGTAGGDILGEDYVPMYKHNKSKTG